MNQVDLHRVWFVIDGMLAAGVDMKFLEKEI
jgi:hypothetical protein